MENQKFDMRVKYGGCPQFKGSRIFSPLSIVMTTFVMTIFLMGLMFTAMMISGCGQTASQTGTGGAGGSGSVITISGTVSVNASDAKQLGISTQSLSTQSIGPLSLVKPKEGGKVSLYKPKVSTSGSSSLEYEKVEGIETSVIDGNYKLEVPQEKLKDENLCVVKYEHPSGEKALIQSSFVTLDKTKKEYNSDVDPTTAAALATLEGVLTKELGTVLGSLKNFGLQSDTIAELTKKIVDLAISTVKEQLNTGKIKSEEFSMIAQKSEIKDTEVRIKRNDFETKIKEISEDEKFTRLADTYESKIYNEFRNDKDKYNRLKEEKLDDDLYLLEQKKFKETFTSFGGGSTVADDFVKDITYAGTSIKKTLKDLYEAIVKSPGIEYSGGKKGELKYDLGLEDTIKYLEDAKKDIVEKMKNNKWEEITPCLMPLTQLIDTQNPLTFNSDDQFYVDELMMLVGPLNHIYHEVKKLDMSRPKMYVDFEKVATALGIAGMYDAVSAEYEKAYSSAGGTTTVPIILPPPPGSSTITISPTPPADSTISPIPTPGIPTPPTYTYTDIYKQNDFMDWSSVDFMKYWSDPSQYTAISPPPLTKQEAKIVEGMKQFTYYPYSDQGGEDVIRAEAMVRYLGESVKVVLEKKSGSTWETVAELKERKDDFYKSITTASTSSIEQKIYNAVIDPYSGDAVVKPTEGTTYRIKATIKKKDGKESILYGMEKGYLRIDDSSADKLPIEIYLKYDSSLGKLTIKTVDKGLKELLKKLDDTLVAYFNVNVYDINLGREVLGIWGSEVKNLFLVGQTLEKNLKGISSNTNITFTLHVAKKDKDNQIIGTNIFISRGLMDNLNSYITSEIAKI